MKSGKNLRIITNNPLVAGCMGPWYEVELCGGGHRDVLVKARDLVFAGYALLTHPISGSVKPNETPYKSIAVTRTAQNLDPSQAELVSNALATFDSFPQREQDYTPSVLEDFQLIDYTLLASALDFDAAAGLSNHPNHPDKS